MNYSSSSVKLLEKVLLVALSLERRGISRLPLINFNSSHKRRLLLFTALSLISSRIGRGLGNNASSTNNNNSGGQLLQLDWLTELLGQVLCHVKFEVSLKVIKVEGGLRRLCQDLVEARKLKALQVFRARLRNDSCQQDRICLQDLQSFLLVLEERKKQKKLQMHSETNAKLELELANLRLEDPTLRSSVLGRFLHVWRCLLNLRLVKSRTRQRFKVAVLGKWRKSTRVSTIAGIYYGKKVKLRLMNRWFSKRFGRAKEQEMITRLNDFIAKKKRRAMFLSKDQVARSYALTGKGLFQVWRWSLRGRKAESFHQTRLIGRVYRRLAGIVALNQGRAQTSRLYNEIRLLKNVFYTWFSAAIPDRFVFSRDRMFLVRKEIKVKRTVLGKWLVKTRNLNLIQRRGEELEGSLQVQKFSQFLATWRLLTKHHAARLVWTDNFRFTEDLRLHFQQWRQESKNQITADTKYQYNLCKTALSQWRDLFSVRQDRRFQLKKHFSLWKSTCQGARGLRFLAGQRLLRRLTRFKATNESISRALTSENSEFAKQDNAAQHESNAKIIRFFQWKWQVKRIALLTDLGDGCVFEKYKKFLQIWRLKAAHANVVRSEPLRLKHKTLTAITKHLQSLRQKNEQLDTNLFHYYTLCAVRLESKYFHQWESAFQVTQVGEHCCAQLLEGWESRKRAQLFHSWQLQTAGIIFGKCKRITEQQKTFSIWRQTCNAERSRRSMRCVSKHFQLWRQAHHHRNLENREIRFRHLKCKLRHISLWIKRIELHQQSHSRANDFFFIVHTSRSIDAWRKKLENARLNRSKTQNLLLLRAPLVRKPRIEQLMAQAASLSDLSHKSSNNTTDTNSNDQLIMENLNIAELSV